MKFTWCILYTLFWKYVNDAWAAHILESSFARSTDSRRGGQAQLQIQLYKDDCCCYSLHGKFTSILTEEKFEENNVCWEEKYTNVMKSSRIIKRRQFTFQWWRARNRDKFWWASINFYQQHLILRNSVRREFKLGFSLGRNSQVRKSESKSWKLEHTSWKPGELKLETRDKSWKLKRAQVGNFREQKFGGNYPQPKIKIKMK